MIDLGLLTTRRRAPRGVCRRQIQRTAERSTVGRVVEESAQKTLDGIWREASHYGSKELQACPSLRLQEM